MAQNVTIAGAQYSDVPAVSIPKTSGGGALFLDAEEYRTAAEQDVIDGGKVSYSAQDKTEAEVAAARDNLGLPFGRNKKVKIPIIENKTITGIVYDNYLGCYRSDYFSNRSDLYGDISDDLYNSLPKKVLLVEFNGVEYVVDGGWLVSAQMTSGGASNAVLGLCIGNTLILQAFENTNLSKRNNILPFLFCYGNFKKNVTDKQYLLLTSQNIASVTYSIYDITGDSIPLPPYLNYANEGLVRVGQGAHGVLVNSALYAGTTAFAEGAASIASGAPSHAEGLFSEASGQVSHAEGAMTKATGLISHTEGQETLASGESSHAEGYKTKAIGVFSHAEGRETTASNNQAHAEGHQTIASGSRTHAEGYATEANGNISHAEGQYTAAGGVISHAGGNYSTTGTNARAAFAHGNFAKADYASTFCVGYGNNPQSDSVFEVGNGLNSSGQPNTTGNVAPVTRQNAFRVTQSGDCIAQNSFSIEKGNGTRVTITAAQLEALLALLS